ncbi:DUF1456 family protein [Paenimyroides tangerinum]|uniref:DUF1456 family protein n=1 Tax=Paenimyroides tangerinum TaxID=2488728 RepID=A0A3P3W7Z5_9FLAO|nr:DUF1456 family protein [Paenimyroides tangerinum]RRJ91282.1 DUF1456 family protein [Paenimyroides tangerinum]
MTNNDIFKKLRVALQLRDDQIVEILELVDFRISKGELGNVFRTEDHEKYMECGDQLLRNFLNGLVIHLRGTKENPKTPMDVIKSHKNTPEKKTEGGGGEKKFSKPFKSDDKKPSGAGSKPFKKNFKKPEPKQNPVEFFKFNSGKGTKKNEN